ncbi:MAG TPA: Rieske (2Fe-2S) protein [Polyangia bacterium]|jgi:Rieske Fe-S protein
MPLHDEQRRRFCQATGLVLIGATLPGCGDAPPAMVDMLACGPTSVGVGIDITSLTIGSAMYFQTGNGVNVFVCRDADGVFALDAGCTHLGCDVMFVDAKSGFHCPCHGATYDFNGDKPTPPAPKPLQHYLVCATVSGQAVVDINQVVDPSTRYKL